MKEIQFKEGEHYKVLELEGSRKPTVAEYFSFYSPHSYSFQTVAQQLMSQLPDDVKFEKVHLSFMGGGMGLPASKAYATMVTLVVEDKMLPVIFERIHTMRKPPKNEAELRRIFLDQGIEAKKFDAAYNGFAVDSMTRRFDKQFEVSGLTGIPAVVVNNRYRVEAQGLKTIKEYFDLIDYLLSLS